MEFLSHTVAILDPSSLGLILFADEPSMGGFLVTVVALIAVWELVKYLSGHEVIIRPRKKGKKKESQPSIHPDETSTLPSSVPEDGKAAETKNS
jgi:hypothetical protein